MFDDFRFAVFTLHTMKSKNIILKTSKSLIKHIMSVTFGSVPTYFAFWKCCIGIPANVNKDDSWPSDTAAPALKKKILVDTRSPLSWADPGAKIQSWQLTPGWSLPSTEESLSLDKHDSFSESVKNWSQHIYLHPSIRLGFENVSDVYYTALLVKCHYLNPYLIFVQAPSPQKHGILYDDLSSLSWCWRDIFSLRWPVEVARDRFKLDLSHVRKENISLRTSMIPDSKMTSSRMIRM